ncbi:hypothetical protein FB45DRAFT_1111250 [Roridomyces roridus]|uniref:Uncharacterized protein n=1 Tax=Roridomyces roridus TaxID=1738132 RepID=A0AAD7B9H6_9AGAR|nr:hypothetical protein FB45DRAFT_1111250 [Roridomyces roridus]
MALARPTLRPFRQLLPLIRFHRSSAHVSRTRSCQNPTLPAIPELFDPNFLDTLIPPGSPPPKLPEDAGPRNPIVEASGWDSRDPRRRPRTKKDPVLAAFNNIWQYAWGYTDKELLDKAWAEDPALTLKIIWKLRGFLPLYEHHPRTAIANLHLLVTPVRGKEGKRSHGYWKDLLNILALATVDELNIISRSRTKFLHGLPDVQPRISPSHGPKKLGIKTRRAAVGVPNHTRIQRKLVDPKYRALFIAVARLFSDRLLADWRLFYSGQDHDISLAPKWAPSPLAMHDRHTNISTAIARLILHDGPVLALPSVYFPTALKDLSLESPEATDILRSFYRRWILTPLRAATRVPEMLMSTNRWADIPYNRVGKVCMKKNEYRFFLHDPERFQEYLVSIDKGRRRRPVDSVTAATLQPHELIGELAWLRAPYTAYPELQKHREALVEEDRPVLEEQWKTVVQNLREARTVENAIAVLDASGSMGAMGCLKYHGRDRNETYVHTDVLPAVSLSLILAQLAKPPFNGFITFSQDPEFVKLDPGKRLRETVMDMGNAPWQRNVDLYAVFMHVILPLAIENKVKPEDMLKRVYVFTDQKFHECVSEWEWRWRWPRWRLKKRVKWETTYGLIGQAFKEAGYEVPKIVFWNLGEWSPEPAKDLEGVKMMGEFTPALLREFMGETEEVGKNKVAKEEKSDWEKDVAEGGTWLERDLRRMRKELEKDCYAGLVVLD